MKRQEVLQCLALQKEDLKQRFGVKSLALFGSVARDEATDASDVDVLAEFDRPVGYFALIGLQEHLESVLGCKVDVGTPHSLKPRIRANVLRECVHVA
jgi:uncharacterized protein